MSTLLEACRDTVVGMLVALLLVGMFGGAAVCLAMAVVTGSAWWAAAGVVLLFAFQVTIQLLFR